MALILSLDTATGITSVALHDQGKLLATSEIHVNQSAASKLALLIEDVKKNAGIELRDLKAVAISSGPGSYTGLRIGTSTAKGICFALDIPLIAVNTLDLMSYQINKFNHEKALLCPMIDARRMEVYCQVTDHTLQIIQSIAAKIIEVGSFSEVLNNNQIIFFGDGAMKCSDVLKHENAVFIENIFPQASSLGELAYLKFQSKLFEHLASFEPLYLKEFVVKKANAGQ